MKVLPKEKATAVEDLIYKYLYANELLEYGSVANAMKNLQANMNAGHALVLVDDVDNPEMFFWGQFIDAPMIFTEIKELVMMASWAEDVDGCNTIIEAAKHRCKLRGYEHLFIGKTGKQFPFNMIEMEGFEIFETAYHIKL